MISAAGKIAEKMKVGRWNHAGAKSDERSMFDVARGVGKDGTGGREDAPMVRAIIRGAVAEAKRLMTFRWPAVECIAAQLLQRETLTFEEEQEALYAALMKR